MQTGRPGNLDRLAQLAFHRAEWATDVVRGLQDLLGRTPPDPLMHRLLQWLSAPQTLWPVSLHDLGRNTLLRLQAGKPVDDRLRLLLELLGDPPADDVIEAVAATEHVVQSGKYERWVRSNHKFDATEAGLGKNPEFLADWERIKNRFDVAQFRDRKGILRRSMNAERNYDPDRKCRWNTVRSRFTAVFDVFCWRWNLYGMAMDSPLLNKLTVNLTPNGTMIFIPAFWSFDAKRDLDWKEITRLHRARSAKKQGVKLARNQAAAKAQAERALQLSESATRAGLKGSRKKAWIMEQLGLDARTDESHLRRLLKRAAAPGGSRKIA